MNDMTNTPPERIWCDPEAAMLDAMTKLNVEHPGRIVEYVRADLVPRMRAIADELPPLDTPVWLFEDERIYIGERWVSEDTDGYLWAEVRDVPCWVRDHWESSCPEMEDLHPTHWMPLPSAREDAK